jgi:chaperonin GroES
MQPVLKKVQPLLGRVLIQKYVPSKKTSSGVLLPDSKNTSNIGLVVEVGSGKLNENGQQIKPTLKAGQYVLLPEYGGVKVPKTESKEELVIFQEEDIIAVVEGDFNTKI